MNEATARLKINKLLERAGWRFFPEGDQAANVRLEASIANNHPFLDGNKRVAFFIALFETGTFQFNELHSWLQEKV